MYEMDGKTDKKDCNCVCNGTSENYCGCEKNYQVFGLKSISFLSLMYLNFRFIISNQ